MKPRPICKPRDTNGERRALPLICMTLTEGGLT